jgi:hypothetical protein
MFRYRTAAGIAALAAAVTFTTGCSETPRADAAQDADFAALQDRDAEGMGVDQYASTHLFDALPDGGRIEFQYDSDDPEGVAQIRSHLQEIQVAFQAGDFSTPAFVHDQDVPGTAVMAERREHIEYRYQELPRGGELRLITSDPRALEAIHDFMAFQRADHRAGGMDHAAMGGADTAFAADMELVHQLVTNNRAITRTVEHLPNGIRTLTESSSPAIAGYIAAHVASMERRLDEGEVFNLFSPTIPILFENYDRIRSEFEYTPTGVTVVQTSDDPALVEALQAHAAEVTELVDEGMIAMMRGMMESGMQGMMMGGMHGAGEVHQPPTP